MSHDEMIGLLEAHRDGGQLQYDTGAGWVDVPASAPPLMLGHCFCSAHLTEAAWRVKPTRLLKVSELPVGIVVALPASKDWKWQSVVSMDQGDRQALKLGGSLSWVTIEELAAAGWKWSAEGVTWHLFTLSGKEVT